MIGVWLRRVRDFLGRLTVLRQFLRGCRQIAAGVLGAAVCAALLELGMIGGVVTLITLLQPLDPGQTKKGRVIQFLNTALPGHSVQYYTCIVCLLVIAAVTAKNAMTYLNVRLGLRLRHKFMANLRGDLFNRLHHADLEVFETKKAGEFGNVFFTETYRAAAAVDHVLLIIQRSVLLLMFCLTLFWVSVTLTVAVGILLGAVAAVSSTLHGRVVRRGREVTASHKMLGGLLSESFSGIRVVRATNSQGLEYERFQKVNEENCLLEDRAARVSGALPPLIETSAIGAAMILVLAAQLWFIRSGLMTSAQLLMFLFVLMRLLPLVNQIYGLLGYVLYLTGSVDEIRVWMNAPLFPRQPHGQREFSGVQKSIRFEGVEFTYPNGKVALSGVDFEIPAGKTVAVVGSSGSGKSTVASLLLRFRAPSGGRIVIDGVNYWDFSPASWHRRIGVVEQESFLFHDTVKNNIAYGLPDATSAQIGDAVKMAHLEEVIQNLSNGVDTLVGERGISLSGGQRQRMAIARALVRQPSLLILDEATSALDTVSERQVQETLDAAQVGRTVLVIAHRLSTIRNADWIVVMHEGRVAEQGTWEQLSANGGMFSRLLK